MSEKRSRAERQGGAPAPRASCRLRRLNGRKKATIVLVGALAIVVAVVGFALPASKKGPPPNAVDSGVAPAFSGRDLVSGRMVSNASLRGQNVLLFFSEGIMCQACFEQIQSLQARADQLEARGLTLVNITTDPPDALRQAVRQYGITTPTLSDRDGAISTVYGAIGQGMHPNTDGHTFVLLDRDGRIRWRHDYQTMFVPPDELLVAIPRVS